MIVNKKQDPTGTLFGFFKKKEPEVKSGEEKYDEVFGLAANKSGKKP
jgi:hypothetical protein